MRSVDVVIPTLRRSHAFACLTHLRFVPWPIRLRLITEGRSWSEAVNLGLAEVGDSDVILMDDDVFLRQDTFDLVEKHYDAADVFGFKLKYQDGRVQHAGGRFVDGAITHIGWGQQDSAEFNRPLYCCHVTTSLVYIKNRVLKQLKGMATDYPGMQFEDVDFAFRALKAGFQLMYLPGEAVHLESASKKWLPGFGTLMEKSYAELKRRYFGDAEFVELLKTFPKEVYAG